MSGSVRLRALLLETLDNGRKPLLLVPLIHLVWEYARCSLAIVYALRTRNDPRVPPQPHIEALAFDLSNPKVDVLDPETLELYDTEP